MDLNKIYKRKTLLVLYCLFSISQLIAQPIGTLDSPRDYKQTVQSPNVWTFAQYLEHPVDFYTGLPIIEVPLYDIKTGSLTFPISLSYHASGIRVNQMASTVGLGWKISTSNAITREVRGFPDDLKERNYRDFQGDEYTSENAGYLYGGYNQDMTEIAVGMYDAIPDLFMFNCGKYSGKFFLSQEGVPQLVPQQDVSIKMIRANGNTGEIIGFTIVTPEGTIYDYKDIEKCYEASASFLVHGESAKEWDAGDFHGPFFGCMSGPAYAPTLQYYKPRHRVYNSSWFLTSIRSAKGNVMQFSYESEHQLIRCYGGAHNDLINSTIVKDKPIDYYYGYFRTAYSSYFETQRLTKITGNNIEISFKYKIREDSEYSSDYHPHYNYALKDIEIKDTYFNRTIKSIELISSYFVSPDPNIKGHTKETKYNSYPSLDAVLSKRLKLEQVLIKNGSEKIPYSFDYYESSTFPSRISDEKDLWGFYNDNNAAGIVPEFYDYPDDPYGDDNYYLSTTSVFRRERHNGKEIYYPGANKMSNSKTIASLSLKNIHYPTGGLTNYEYEMHKFYINGEEKAGGGIRIAKIIKSTDAKVGNSDDLIYTYKYHESGKIIKEPVLAYCETAYEKFPEVGNAVHSEPEGGISFSKGSFVTYTKVSEIIGEAETEYIYDHSGMLGTVQSEYSSDKQEYIFLRPKTKGYGYTSYIGTVYDANGNQLGPEPYDAGPGISKVHKCPYYPNYDWRRTLLRQTNYYRIEDDSRIPIKKIANTFITKKYSKIPLKWTALVHKNGAALHNTIFPSTNPYFPTPTVITTGLMWTAMYAYSDSYFLSPWIVLSETTKTDYGTNGSSISKTTTYGYGKDHTNPISIIERSSNGDELKTTYKYPTDYNMLDRSTTIEGKALEAMVGMNMINKPIETVSYKNNKLIGASLNTFQKNNKSTTKTVVPYYSAELVVESTDSGFEESRNKKITESKYQFTYDSRYVRTILFDEFDAFCNVQQFTNLKSEITTSYLWANHQYPIIKGVNIPLETLRTALSQTVAGTYNTTLYEALENGYYQDHWSGAKTILTDNDKFAYYSKLRRNLPDAQLYTYTYKPLTGMTSQTDPNGVTTYFEYDGLGRLKCTKDKDYNILESYEYNYKQ